MHFYLKENFLNVLFNFFFILSSGSALNGLNIEVCMCEFHVVP